MLAKGTVDRQPKQRFPSKTKKRNGSIIKKKNAEDLSTLTKTWLQNSIDRLDLTRSNPISSTSHPPIFSIFYSHRQLFYNKRGQMRA